MLDHLEIVTFMYRLKFSLYFSKKYGLRNKLTGNILENSKTKMPLRFRTKLGASVYAYRLSREMNKVFGKLPELPSNN